MRYAGFFLFFQCSAFSFPHSFLHTITPITLKEYVTIIPDVKAQQWVERNADFLAYLARIPHPLSDWPTKYTNANWHLHKRGIKNHAFTNFVFQIPDTTYWIQIGGPKHRVRNIYTYNTNKNSYAYLEIAKHWELRNSTMLDEFEIVPTYQTISRFANFLLLEHAIKQLDCTLISIAPTYLVHIPGYATHVCDEEYVVVQEHVPDIMRLRDAPERMKDIAPAALQELFNVICTTGYWNTKNGIYVTQDNEIVLLDYEQRNIENPIDFFHKDVNCFEECVYTGIHDLAMIHLKPHASHLFNQLIWLIAQERSLQFSSLSTDFDRLMCN